MSDSRTSDSQLPRCVCGHPADFHLTATYQGERAMHSCFGSDCGCQDYEAQTNVCPHCGAVDGGHTLACQAISQELAERGL